MFNDHSLMVLLFLLLFSQPSPLVTRLHAGAAQPSTLQLLWPCPLLLPTQQPAGHRQCHGQTTSEIATTGRRDQGTVLDHQSKDSHLCADGIEPEGNVLPCWAWTPHFLEAFFSSFLLEVFESRMIPGQVSLCPNVRLQVQHHSVFSFKTKSRHYCHVWEAGHQPLVWEWHHLL